MDAQTALALVNDELRAHGHPPVLLTEQQANQVFQTLQAYAAAAQRPLDIAICDVVRFQLQTETLQRSN